ncbi:site-specific tyrosine recombinase XerC [Planctomycetes bacterium Pan216]|uniref:Site-specific tyrosine recombinase XerC n=1 Tax=Kolteria novifilia TaxID=2527975 RepID=A0A518B8T2_9BACT|nr:site-specific tyrosine recombinase XerC [Planctomycetes bacterium Pan216]
MPERTRVWIQQRKGRTLALEWHDPTTGKRRTKSTGTNDWRAAEQQRAELEVDLNRGVDVDSGRMKWSRLRELYESEKLIETSATNQQRARDVFDVFERHVKLTTINSITERTIAAFVAKLRERELSPFTVQLHLRYLRVILRWAFKRQYIERVPTIEMPPAPKAISRRKIRGAANITGEVFDRLIAACPNDGWRLFLAFCWHAGLRSSEARNVRGEDIDLEGHRILIPTPKRGSSDEHAIVSPELDAILRERFPGGLPIDRLIPSDEVNELAKDRSGRFQAIAKRAGISGGSKSGLITLHDLRRSVGSRWAGKVPAQVLQKLMRHASLATTMGFYADTEAAAVDALWRDQAKHNVAQTWREHERATEADPVD